MSILSSASLKNRRKSGLLGLALAACLSLGSAREASAMTIILDFVTGSTTDIFNVGTTTANYAPYGFTGLTTSQIEQGLLAEVMDDYLSYPTVGADPNSPLPNGKELDLYFELGHDSTTAPSNGDSEYYYVAIGNKTTGDTFLGQACYGCLRPTPGWADNHDIVASILVDNIASLAGLAATNAQRFNLLAGTIAHEIGHALQLDHPTSQIPNPGESAYDIMATGAAPTSMPNGERVKDRAFSYADFQLLINNVGLRDVPSEVPEPAALALFVLGGGLLFLKRRKESRA